jgi:hypothetical protein
VGCLTRSRSSDARSCAAQAIVAIRQRLPLISVDLTHEKPASAHLEPGTAERLIGLLPSPEAVQQLTGLALMCAAVCVAEEVEGRTVGDVGQHDAVRQIWGVGATLRVPDGEAWFLDCLDRARTILTENDALWDRLRVTLERKKRMTADEIRQMVG